MSTVIDIASTGRPFFFVWCFPSWALLHSDSETKQESATRTNHLALFFPVVSFSFFLLLVSFFFFFFFIFSVNRKAGVSWTNPALGYSDLMR